MGHQRHTEAETQVLGALRQGADDDLGERFVRCFVRAADDAGLPDDADLRAALRSYMEWAVHEVLSYSPAESDVPANLPVPHWSWDGLQDVSRK